MLKLSVLAALLVAVIASPAPASATVILRLDLDTLVGRADRVVVGKVERVKAAWGATKRIFTTATIRIETGVLGVGATEKTLVVRALGGVVDGVGMRVSGAPRLTVGQRVLLFTELRGKNRYIVGMRQGLFRVAKTAGKQVVRRSLAGLTFAKVNGRSLTATRKLAPTALDRVQRLDDFIARIRATKARCARQANRCVPARLRP